MCIISFNTYRDATTILSGAQYMLLPSHYYITEQFKLDKTTNQNGIKTNESEDIPVGSFLLSVNGIPADSIKDLDRTIKNISGDSTLQLKIFNLNKVNYLHDNNNIAHIYKISDTFYVKKSNIPPGFIKFIDGGNFLGWLLDDGATQRAGIKAGDVLISINSKEIKLLETGEFTIESLKFLRNQSRDEPVHYKILRNNREMIIDVYLLTFGLPLITVLLILCGLIMFATGIYFGTARPYFPTARLVSYLFIIIGFEFSLSNSYYPPDYDLFSLFKIFINNATSFFPFPLILHSLYYFPVINRKILKRRFNIYIYYIIAIAQLIIFTIWFFVDYRSIIGIIFTISTFAGLLYYIILFIISFKSIPDEEKKTYKIANLIWLFIFLVSFVRPILEYSLKIDFPEWFQYSFLSILLIPIVYLYLTWRYNLLDINIHIRRNILYNLNTVIWKALFLFSFVFILFKLAGVQISFPEIRFAGNSIEWNTSNANNPDSVFLNKIFIVICALLITVILLKLGKVIQNYLDKIFYRQQFDYKITQTDLIGLLRTKLSVESLAPFMVEKISEIVKLKKTGILFFYKDDRIWNNIVYCYDNQKKRDFEKDIHPAIISSLKYHSSLFSINQCPEDCKNFFSQNNLYNIIPIKTKEKYLGALFIGEKLSETNLNEEDVEFLSSIVASSSVAVENAFLYEELTNRERIKKELEIAHHIQVASLPQNVPVVPGLDIYAISVPALEVGGDFYDFLNGKPDGLTIVMGDVSGKGTSAALYMSKVQGIFQTLHEFNLSPIKLLIRANQLLYKHIDSKSYVTAIGANFNTEHKTLSFARAGHLPLYYFSNDLKDIRKIQPSGIGLGLSEKNVFDHSIEEILIEYYTGDIFLFVSDGVTEALNWSNEQFGELRLMEIIKDNYESDSKILVNKILETVKTFSSNTNQFDDITVVIVKII